MVWIAVLAVLALVGVVVAAARSAGVWKLEFDRGRLVRTRGKIATPVLRQLVRVAERHGVSGQIRYLLAPERLEFSPSIDQGVRQFFLNVFFSRR